ncbi:PepSY domain-containing protein [Caulobacter segnis]|uniref:PepSY-associated TM helix domain-containing protein n=1 Tax=Caulobacter segnis TaxID=88688 RepID=UPI0024101756|nr:PepSY domain-containing protein [Caulobacter segnis]MDG2522167.1 PepSY domain-containing protein [Caulobacter segnis]
MKHGTLRSWFWVHKWTSLLCTLFLLLLCVTGLPLIFSEEIGHLTGSAVEPAPPSAGSKPLNVDDLVATANAKYPADVPLFFGWDPHSTGVYVNLGAEPSTPAPKMNTVVMDSHTARDMEAPQFNTGFMYVLLRLHTDLYGGLVGYLFLGVMGLLFVVSTVSGVVLYAPFMKKQPFGVFRTDRSRRLAWLDLHNLLGAASIVWVLTVGVTGAFNTIAGPLQSAWQADAVSAFAAKYEGRPLPSKLASVHQAIETAKAAEPGMRPAFVSWPGTGYSGDHHYGVFMSGTSPLTAQLYRPVLIDAASGRLTAQPKAPWYITALLLSQPLHFGNYGGLALKFIWALFDLLVIAILVSGVVLWLRKSGDTGRLERLKTAHGVEAVA